ncbi:unnamed protein product [Musa banksii]
MPATARTRAAPTDTPDETWRKRSRRAGRGDRSCFPRTCRPASRAHAGEASRLEDLRMWPRQQSGTTRAAVKEGKRWLLPCCSQVEVEVEEFDHTSQAQAILYLQFCSNHKGALRGNKVGYAFHYKKKSVIKTEEEEESLLGKIRGRGRRRSVAKAGGSGWVELLLRSKFFGVCEEHKETRKSEENIYCVDCGRRMCPHCVAGPACPHRAHRLLQIRRYVYQDVVRVHDMQKLLDCSRVQPYTVNGAKVVLLNPRTQSKPSKSNAGGSACQLCRRSISELNRYCSIACMADVEGAAATGPIGCNPSEPFLPTLTAGLEGSQSPSCSFSPQPSDACRDDFHPRITEPPCPKVHRRKGRPRRAPLL